MADFLEMLMMFTFGFSWPFSIVKAYKARTAAGTSIAFLVLVEFGYFCGIAAKFISGHINYVLFFYILNTVLVGTAICIYFRNRVLDRERTLLRVDKND